MARLLTNQRSQIVRPHASASNGLLNNLVAYWPLNEAAGANNALDLHTNGLTLTQGGAPGSAAGKVYAGARTFDSTSMYFNRASETLLQTGDIDFTITAWVYLGTKAPSQMYAVSKYRYSDNKREFLLDWLLSTDRFRFLVSPDGTNVAIVSSTTFGAPSASTWYFVACYHDSVNNKIGISVNNGAFDTTNHTTGVLASAAPFAIGTVYNEANPIAASTWWNGRQGPVTLHKSAAGGGGVLSATKLTALYNAGAGMPYASFTA